MKVVVHPQQQPIGPDGASQFNRKMLEFLDSLDRGAQQRDNSATLHHLSDRFERQAAAATACSNVMIEQCNPSLASLGE